MDRKKGKNERSHSHVNVNDFLKNDVKVAMKIDLL